MKKFAHIILGILCVFLPRVCVGLDISGDYTFGDEIDTNEEIHIVGLCSIKNYGVLRGTIIIDSGATVRFQNFGEITSVFNVADDVAIIQNVTSADDMHTLGNLAGHTVHVSTLNPDGTKDILDMADFIDFVAGASSVEVESGAFMIGSNVPDNNIPINVNNRTTFYINGLPDDWSKPLVKGVVGTPFVETVGIDPMYDVTVDWHGPDLYLSVVRRTDYSAIMPDTNLGNYLDELRDKNPDDKLLNALDNATNRRELNKILSKSARTNPIKLMDAPRSINTFYDSFAMDDVAFGIIARPFYISADDFYFVGGAVNVAGKIANNTVGTVGIIGGMLKYNGDYDDYNGNLYGGNIGIRYMDDDFYLRAFGTVSYAIFDDIYAFDGTHMVQDVNGVGGVATVDTGLVYQVMDELKLIPFVGARVDYASVLNDTKIDGVARAGINANVDTDVDGNKYKFGARLFGQTDGAVYGGIYTDMMSTVDGVGGGASVGVLYDDMGLSYKLELNVKFEF
ncbi:MAG: hypothetical protein J5620_03960 [Alphaproteobacteria bacterium]|nr:hypothetical protein [Alphaproteobacteria bacterium]